MHPSTTGQSWRIHRFGRVRVGLHAGHSRLLLRSIQHIVIITDLEFVSEISYQFFIFMQRKTLQAAQLLKLSNGYKEERIEEEKQYLVFLL